MSLQKYCLHFLNLSLDAGCMGELLLHKPPPLQQQCIAAVYPRLRHRSLGRKGKAISWQQLLIVSPGSSYADPEHI